MNSFFSVFRDKNESHAQMVESNEGARVEGHSLVRYTCLYHRKNQASNSIFKGENRGKNKSTASLCFLIIDVRFDQRLRWQFVWPCHDFHRERWKNWRQAVIIISPIALPFIMPVSNFIDLFDRTFSAFTMDVIARCAFGLKIDTLGKKDDPFITNAQVVLNPPTTKTPLIVLPCTS